jgi:hypothetical protein
MVLFLAVDLAVLPKHGVVRAAAAGDVLILGTLKLE